MNRRYGPYGLYGQVASGTRGEGIRAAETGRSSASRRNDFGWHGATDARADLCGNGGAQPVTRAEFFDVVGRAFPYRFHVASEAMAMAMSW
ncbi:MAG: hypothetical protein ABW220_17255 [Burkholderiaceae bacterium]